MHQNDEPPANGERDEHGPIAGEPAAPDTTDAGEPADNEPGGFAANDVARLARLMPDTSRLATLGVSTNLFNTLGMSTRAFDQITRSARLFDQVGASTRLLSAAANVKGFGLVESRIAELGKMVTPVAWQPPPMTTIRSAVSAWPRSPSLHQALDTLAYTAAIPDWTASFATFSGIYDSIGAWRIPGWTMPNGVTMLVGKNQFSMHAFQSGLFDILHGIREQLAAADEFASSLFLAALDTRDAILTDPDSPTVVRHFARTWLRIRTVTQYVVDAIIDVLLSDDWHELDLTEEELRAHLRARAQDRHAVHRPIFERQLNGRQVGSLSAEITTTDGVLALDQVVAGTHDTEHEALFRQWADPRIGPLLNKLTLHQRRVVDTIAHSGLGWQEAAAVAGVTAQQAEGTRRRLKYLVTEQNRRHGRVDMDTAVRR